MLLTVFVFSQFVFCYYRHVLQTWFSNPWNTPLSAQKSKMFLDFCCYVYRDTIVIVMCMICFTIYWSDQHWLCCTIINIKKQYSWLLILVYQELNIHLTIFLSFAIPTHKHESTRADPLSWLSLSERSCSSPILPGPWLPRHTKESSVELSKEKHAISL